MSTSELPTTELILKEPVVSEDGNEAGERVRLCDWKYNDETLLQVVAAVLDGWNLVYGRISLASPTSYIEDHGNQRQTEIF